MPENGRRSRSKYHAEGGIGVLMVLLLTLAFGLGGGWSAAGLGFVVLFLVPGVSWSLITEVLAGRFLLYFLVARTHEFFLPRILQDRFLPRSYFRQPGSQPPQHLWWRTLQVLFLVFFLSSLTVPRFPILVPRTLTGELAEFWLFGVLYLSALAPVLALVWVYEDWGLRGYDDARGRVYPIGSSLVGAMSGFGALGTFARFVLSLGVSGAEVAGSVILLLVSLFPSCLVVTAFFHDVEEPRLLAALSRGDVSSAVPLRSVRLD